MHIQSPKAHIYITLLYFAKADQRHRLFCIDHKVQNIKRQYCMLVGSVLYYYLICTCVNNDFMKKMTMQSEVPCKYSIRVVLNCVNATQKAWQYNLTLGILCRIRSAALKNRFQLDEPVRTGHRQLMLTLISAYLSPLIRKSYSKLAHPKYNKLVITWLFSYCTRNTALGLESRAVLRVQYEELCI